MLAEEGSHEEAVRWLTQSISLLYMRRIVGAPSYLLPLLLVRRSARFLDLHKWVRVELDTTVALSLDPDNLMARYNRAIARFKRDKKVEASMDAWVLMQHDLPARREATMYDLLARCQVKQINQTYLRRI